MLFLERPISLDQYTAKLTYLNVIGLVPIQGHLAGTQLV